MTTCRRCLLPDTVPGLRFDDTGLCDLCEVTPPVEELARVRASLRAEMERVIEAHRSDRPYECIVAYSGGKDSSYTLKLLVETYGLRCLAITVDNGFLASRTYANCRAVCEGLGVDHVLFTPRRGFMDGLYRGSAEDESVHPPAAVRRASSICNSCIGLINSHMVQRAVEMDVPLVAGGYIGGQLPRDAARVVLRPGLQAGRRSPMVERMVRHFGEGARPYFTIRPGVDPAREITVINPMLGLAIREDEIMAALAPLGWKRPHETGVTSTNCRMNDLGVYLHQRRHGFHAYALETAEQVRHGLLSLDEAAAKLAALPTRDDVAWIADRIGLDLDAG